MPVDALAAGLAPVAGLAAGFAAEGFAAGLLVVEVAGLPAAGLGLAATAGLAGPLAEAFEDVLSPAPEEGFEAGFAGALPVADGLPVAGFVDFVTGLVDFSPGLGLAAGFCVAFAAGFAADLPAAAFV